MPGAMMAIVARNTEADMQLLFILKAVNVLCNKFFDIQCKDQGVQVPEGKRLPQHQQPSNLLQASPATDHIDYTQ